MRRVITGGFFGVVFRGAALLGLGSLLVAQSCSGGFDIFNIGGGSTIHGVYRSGDGGENWSTVHGSADQGVDISSISMLSLVVDPIRVDTVYGGTLRQGIVLSENGGKSWRRLSIPLGRVDDIVFDPIDTDRIYASGFAANAGKIYRSDDRGETWEEVYSDPEQTITIRTLAVDPNSPNVLYAGLGSGSIVTSQDGGDTWVALSWNNGLVRKMLVDPADSSRLIIGAVEEGVWVSENSGRSFTQVFDETDQLDGANNVFDIALDPQQSSVVYVASEFGLLKSPNGGRDWDVVNTVIPVDALPINFVLIDPLNSSRVYLGASNTFVASRDGGRNWFVETVPTSGVLSVATINPANTSYLYVGAIPEN